MKDIVRRWLRENGYNFNAEITEKITDKLTTSYRRILWDNPSITLQNYLNGIQFAIFMA